MGTSTDKVEATKAGLPKAVILEREQKDSERVNGATYLDRETFDKVARAGGFGDADSIPADSSLDLSGLSGKHKTAVEEVFTEQKKTR